MKTRLVVPTVLFEVWSLFGCSNSNSSSPIEVTSSTGGSTAVTGGASTNNITALGGVKGGSVGSSGGATSFGMTGGIRSTGGGVALGGATATGGRSTLGGSNSTGGSLSTGGGVTTGGKSSSSGGTSGLTASGGNTSTAGASIGGISATGGMSSTGGTSTGTGGTTTTVQATITVSGANPMPVASTFFGQNYWSWVPDWGDPVAGIQAPVAALKLNLIRAGGANNDQQSPAPFSQTEMDAFVAYAKAIGAEPLVQIPLLKNLPGAAPTAQDAAAIVTYLNKTKAYGVRYFSIGNEPDLYTEQGFKDASYSAATYCSSFSSFASAMKAVDSTIKIMGPELSWKYVAGNDWLTPFLQNCGSAVDIVSVHRYPFTSAQSTEANAYADAATFRTVITSTRALMSTAGQGSKPLAITEANITWDGDPAKPQQTASPQTFPAGLWVADNLGVGLEAGLLSIDYWSLSEGHNLGFFAGSTPKPAYYVLQMFSTKFGNQSLTVSGTPSNVSVYAGRNTSAAKTTVFVVNKTSIKTTLGIKFEGLVRSDTVTMTAEARSLTAAEYPDSGAAVITSYTSAMAQPTVVTN